MEHPHGATPDDPNGRYVPAEKPGASAVTNITASSQIAPNAQNEAEDMAGLHATMVNSGSTNSLQPTSTSGTAVASSTQPGADPTDAALSQAPHDGAAPSSQSPPPRAAHSANEVLSKIPPTSPFLIIDEDYHKATTRPKMQPGSYTAALLLTGSLVPLPVAAAAITATLYIALAGWQGIPGVPTHLLIILSGLGITLLLWLLVSLPFKPFTSFENVNTQSGNHLKRHLLALQSVLKLLKERLDPSSKGGSLVSFRNKCADDYDLAFKSVCENLIEANNQLASEALSWVTGSGYLKAWNFVLRAEEAMLDIAPREYVIREALHDESAIDGSAIASRDYVLSNLKTAVKALSPSAAVYLKSLPVQDRNALPASAPASNLPGASNPPEQGREPDAVIELEARNALRDARQVLNEFRASLWDGLVRVRNQLLGTALITGLLTYTLLFVTISVDVKVESMEAAIIFYLVGSTVGLFSRLSTESQTNKAVDDYGLTVARIVIAPLLSGLAAIAGVLVVAVLSINVLNAPGTTPPNTGVPQLQVVYDLVQNRQGIVVAAVFGLTPNLFINILQQKASNAQTKLEDSSAPNQGKS